ncbi:nuclear transport factor 2 family protein [Amycolatopsis carbonis]|uniref:Nuclear transport factor 2 family protein n=1 Tax=Amycolatopsis carbonis TaxID=715471 RepID=A0A9Y2I9L5_9PSEU|nr:nuclear transport factor 2 family protein [Amycolatopsis sp. 2-15]WIX75060.1 nuclear transport factor 2 family protein [Amycolatopsis sp. 2-15]
MTALTGVLADHVRAVNAFDLDGIVATFAEDALVNDARREFWGIDAIRAWAAAEMVGDHVTLRVTDVVDHHGVTLVRAAYEGDYPKAGLPDPLIMTNYFTVRAGKIDSMFVIRNEGR